MKNFALVFSVGLATAAALCAQETSRFTFAGGGGFTTPVGRTGTHLDYGWNVRGGAGVNFTPHFGALIDVGFDSFGINSATLTQQGFPGGDMHVFSATLDPIVHLNPQGHADIYITGGGGLYHRNVEFTQPAVAVATGFDPFFGFFPVAFNVNQVLASYSVNKPGVDIGLGVALGTKWHGKIFAEARYNRIFLGNYHTDYLPVTFGVRW